MLAKVNPLVFNMEKALCDPVVSQVASFAVEACNKAYNDLKDVKEKAERINIKPCPDEDIPWDRDYVALVCKDAASSVGTLNNMLKAARAFLTHR